jgi:hypothetical protein
MSEPTEKPDKAPLHIFIPKPWDDWLRDEAHAKRISKAKLVRAALQQAYKLGPDTIGD